MSGVIEMPRRTAPPKKPVETLDARFGNDAWILKMCADWRAARAQMLKNLAEYELANGWGTLPDAHINLDKKPLQQMEELEGLIVMCKPRTALLAREMLGICITILAYENPEETLGRGPVLEIIRNVVSSLDFLKADMRIGPKREQRDD